MDNNEKNPSDPILPSSQEDCEQIWLSIATDIQIRKFENLDDIPEFHQLSDELQKTLKSELTTLNNQHKMFYDEQELKNFHVILYVKDKENYLAIYEEQTQSQQIRAIVKRMRLAELYQCLLNSIHKDPDQDQTSNNDHQEQSQPIEKNNSNSTGLSRWRNFLSRVPNTNVQDYMPSFLQQSTSTSELRRNELIETCMVRKLESILNAK
ncbi:unnamed protein product [Adineta ricciae]|uniref:Uncharacterized protein n=1 Tax=Adineta ricciae TaxID=249248 RepID=A0A815RY02_ADIRI|nr:unnamed protein product [Adineta ricciae]